ncbi:Putative 3-methyladenine DNA glycosylase [Candidatus Hepatincola sp. Pdp]
MNFTTNNFLSPEFFLQPTMSVAINLLGKELYLHGKSGIITEVESYRADEPSSHSYKGITPRNKPMFEEGGTIYVYSIHQCLCMNLSANKKGIGDAILIRGLWDYKKQELYDGPGKLCKYLKVHKNHNFLTLGTQDFYIKTVNSQKLTEIPYNINIKRKQFLGNFVFTNSNANNTIQNNKDNSTLQNYPYTFTSNAKDTIYKSSQVQPIKKSTKLKTSTEKGILAYQQNINQELYYYKTPRIGLNQNKADHQSLERFVLAEFSTKTIKLA